MIESSHAKHVFTMDLRLTRLRQVPPQVTVDLANLQLAVPPLDNGAGLDENQIRMYIEQLAVPAIQKQIQQLVEGATKQLVKSMPQQGFQTIQLNSCWTMENDDD